MQVISATELSDNQREAVLALWNNEYPTQLQLAGMGTLNEYLAHLINQQHFLAVDSNRFICGWAFSFEREGERWFAIIIDTKYQQQGIGSLLLKKLKETESVLNGWVTDHDRYKKSNGESYLSPLQFYIKNNFKVINDTRLETDKLSAVKILWQKTDVT